MSSAMLDQTWKQWMSSNDYIESLPIISTIPFFSRFKLRKMLRRYVIERPGRRLYTGWIKATHFSSSAFRAKSTDMVSAYFHCKNSPTRNCLTFVDLSRLSRF